VSGECVGCGRPSADHPRSVPACSDCWAALPLAIREVATDATATVERRAGCLTAAREHFVTHHAPGAISGDGTHQWTGSVWRRRTPAEQDTSWPR
jgi:hypothetical protein